MQKSSRLKLLQTAKGWNICLLTPRLLLRIPRGAEWCDEVQWQRRGEMKPKPHTTAHTRSTTAHGISFPHTPNPTKTTLTKPHAQETKTRLHQTPSICKRRRSSCLRDSWESAPLADFICVQLPGWKKLPGVHKLPSMYAHTLLRREGEGINHSKGSCKTASLPMVAME